MPDLSFDLMGKPAAARVPDLCHRRFVDRYRFAQTLAAKNAAPFNPGQELIGLGRKISGGVYRRLIRSRAGFAGRWLNFERRRAGHRAGAYTAVGAGHRRLALDAAVFFLPQATLGRDASCCCP